MIIRHLTDNDLYKFTTMNAVQKLFPGVKVRYEFINRGGTGFPHGFSEALQKEVSDMASLALTRDEADFIKKRCYYFNPVFLDLLKGYRFDPSEVKISQQGRQITIVIEGYWYRTVLWEVPLLAVVSELYYKMNGLKPGKVEERAMEKARKLASMEANYSDFGTRRRFSEDVHKRVLDILIRESGKHFKGTSNVYFANKFHITPIGTHPHEWFMFHGAVFGYRNATLSALDAWVDVYKGDLGIALTDTYTSQVFFNDFGTQYTKLFDGVRCDSGDPVAFTDHVIGFYRQKNINPESKTIVYSDALDTERVRKIREHASGLINDVYGIGTYLTNDAGHQPLNMVIKMTGVNRGDGQYIPVVKMSDDPEKQSGPAHEIRICKQLLNITR
ncbi:MAG: nicotinate phosphoribosyltransferase [Bacteroidales bacterium]|nr:nicotinate phosphoribosyltransferase [Bacteroidales bacterium]